MVDSSHFETDLGREAVGIYVVGFVTKLIVSQLASGLPVDVRLAIEPGCDPITNYQTESLRDVTKVALVTSENREIRTPENTKDLASLHLESNQGRLYCLGPGRKPAQGFPPSKSYLKKNYMRENATVIFEQNIILVSRHVFSDDYGKPKANPKECFFEHIASGSFYKSNGRVAYKKAADTKTDKTYSLSGDYALLALDSPVAGSVPIPRDRIMIDQLRNRGTPLAVISNLAENLGQSHEEDLTIARCQVQNKNRNASGEIVLETFTDCNTGKGSSAATVWTSDSTTQSEPMMFGVVSGDFTEAAPGSGYVPGVLSTIITRFDQSLFDDYDQLKSQK